ncbi:MAG: hypothetical protein EXR85_00620 [Xanthomonadales bacterium]|nr:hypothetical protein [Xanthomonadales bacterium]
MTSPNRNVTAPLLSAGIDPAPRWTGSDYLLAGALVVAGLALRIPYLDQGMWIDELYTLFRHVRESPAQIIHASGLANNHVLYSLLAHYAVNWLGESAWVIRLPAVVFGVAAIPALYHLGRQVAGREEAFLAALFMTLNYQFVWYSQNARGYTGLLFGAVLASILFIRLLATASPTARLIVGYAVVAALTVWIQLTAVFVILAHGTCWLALACKPNRAGRFSAATPVFLALLLAGLFTLALYVPMFGAESNDFEPALVGVGGAEVAVKVEPVPTGDSVISWVLKEFAQGLQRSVPGGWPVVVIVAGVLLAGIGSYLRQGVTIAGVLLLPVLLTFAVIYFQVQYFFPRYVLGSAGFLLLFAVRGGFVAAGWCLPFLSRRSVLLIGSLMALAGTILVPAAWQPKQDFLGAARFIQEQRAAGDGVVCVTQTTFVLKVFLGMDCDGVRSLAQLTRVEALHERTWLIYTLPKSMKVFAPEILQRIRQDTDYAKIREFPGTLSDGNIIVLLKQPTPPGVAPVPDADP